MDNAWRDKNYQTSLLWVSSLDSSIVLPLLINPITGRLLVEIMWGWSWWHIIEDEWIPLPNRSKLNFIWAWVTATDNLLNDSTDVTILWGWDVVSTWIAWWQTIAWDTLADWSITLKWTSNASHTNSRIKLWDALQFTSIFSLIYDSANKLLIQLISTVSAVNYLIFRNQATWTWPTIWAWWTDTNIDINLVTKGVWNVRINWNIVDPTLYELLSNKTTNINDSAWKYPDAPTVKSAIASAVVWLMDYRGSYDASTNIFPATWWSWLAWAILKSDYWICSVPWTLWGVPVTNWDLIIALIDTPWQTSSNWDLISHELWYTPENIANKTWTIVWNESSTTLYSTIKWMVDWTTWLFATISQVLGRQVYHWIVDRSTTSPLPTNLTTTTFTLSTWTTPLTYWRNGVSTLVNTNKTTTLSWWAWLYFIYFNDNAWTLVNSTSFPWVDSSSTTNVFVATVFWNWTDYGLVNDERHWYSRNWAWHSRAHNTIWLRYGTWLALSVTWTWSTATFSLATWVVADEDINFTIPTTTTARQLYQTWATSYWFDKVLTTTPWKLWANNRPWYVDSSTFTWTQVASAANRYLNYFVYATTDLSWPMYVFTETVAASAINAGTWYNSLANARNVGFPNLNSFWLVHELKPIYRVIVRADWAVQAIDPTQDDFRTSSSIPFWAGSTPIAAASVTETNYGNVQTAIDSLISTDALKIGWNTTDNIWYLNIPQNSKSASYTTVLADSWKHIYHPSADTTARTFTIDSNANVSYPIWTALTFINDTSWWVVTIAITTDTLVLAWAWTTWSRTLASNWVATAIKVTSTRWIISWTNLT